LLGAPTRKRTRSTDARAVLAAPSLAQRAGSCTLVVPVVALGRILREMTDDERLSPMMPAPHHHDDGRHAPALASVRRPMGAALVNDRHADCRRASTEDAHGSGRSRASLAWVLTTDGLRHVSTWAHLPPRGRPRNTESAPREVTCPVCERPVLLKLGRKVVHHAAHAPGDPCVVTQPETALHFNLKCHLHDQLAAAVGAGRPLRVTEACMVGQSGLGWKRRYDTPAPADYLRHEWLADPCEERRERVWLEAWDHVELERRVGDERAARIPDIVLYQGGVVVGAIEVFHSHAVDYAKAEALAARDVKWLEVRTDEALLADGSAWTLDTPLPAHRTGPAARWRCAAHEEAREAARQAALEAEAREREAARHSRRVCAVKLVDIRYPCGTPDRNVYRVVEERTDGVLHTIVLERNRLTLLRLPLAAAAKRVLWARIKKTYAADVRGITVKRGAATDCAMGWAKGALAERIAERAASRLWQQVPLEDTHPVRWRFDRTTGTWFQPPELREVRWDRAPDDPLEQPDPAWPRRPPSPSTHPVGRALPVRESRGSARPRWRTPLEARDLGAAVTDVEEATAVNVYALRRAARATARVVVVVRGELSLEGIRHLDDGLCASGIERLWVSHRHAWPPGIDEVPWLPLVAAPDGGHAVPINGVATPVADAVAAFAAGAPALAPANIISRRLARTRRG